MNLHCPLLLLISFVLGTAASAADAIQLQKGVTVRPATVAEGRTILQATDRFTSRLSRFDLESRIGKQDITREDFNEMVKAQVRPWPEEQLAKVQAAERGVFYGVVAAGVLLLVWWLLRHRRRGLRTPVASDTFVGPTVEADGGDSERDEEGTTPSDQ